MEDHSLIENYLKELLSEEQKQAFLKRLDSDAEFRELFSLEKQLFDLLNKDSWSFVKHKSSPEINDYTELLRSDDIQNLKSALTKANSNFKSKSKKPNRKLYYYLAAASIVIFLMVQMLSNQNISNQELYDDFASLNDLPSFVTRGSDDIDNELVNAQILLKSKNYKEALNMLVPILKTNKNDALIYIYTGIAQTELDLFQNAEKTFNDLINSDLAHAQTGYWYKALLLIKTDRIEEAKEILERISSKSLYNHKKAKRLIKKLNDK